MVSTDFRDLKNLLKRYFRTNWQAVRHPILIATGTQGEHRKLIPALGLLATNFLLAVVIVSVIPRVPSEISLSSFLFYVGLVVSTFLLKRFLSLLARPISRTPRLFRLSDAFGYLFAAPILISQLAAGMCLIYASRIFSNIVLAFLLSSLAVFAAWVVQMILILAIIGHFYVHKPLPSTLTPLKRIFNYALLLIPLSLAYLPVALPLKLWSGTVSYSTLDRGEQGAYQVVSALGQLEKWHRLRFGRWADLPSLQAAIEQLDSVERLKVFVDLKSVYVSYATGDSSDFTFSVELVPWDQCAIHATPKNYTGNSLVAVAGGMLRFKGDKNTAIANATQMPIMVFAGTHRGGRATILDRLVIRWPWTVQSTQSVTLDLSIGKFPIRNQEDFDLCFGKLIRAIQDNDMTIAKAEKYISEHKDCGDLEQYRHILGMAREHQRGYFKDFGGLVIFGLLEEYLTAATLERLLIPAAAAK